MHVVAVPDERYGEEAGAVISWKAGIDEARAKRRLKCALHFGTRFVSSYETPKYITSLPKDVLPMTSTGKVQRSILKSQLPYERFESIFGLVKMPERRFTVLHRYSYDLYKQCWWELAPERVQYEKDISKHLIILAADAKDRILGQISVIRTSLSEKELLKKKYAELLSPDVLDREGNALVCISICNADYKPKPVPEVARIPSEDEVRKYLADGHDPVMKFHEKPKGGLAEGAKLIDVIPNGRQEDKSSLGYNMLLKYPSPKENVAITEGSPISNQLIEVVLLLAHDLGIKNVYAYSRPGGLASYLSAKT